jgi:YHS domain-containing protein
MDGLNDLDRRIREQLTTNEEQVRLRQDHVERFMREWQARLDHYTEVADRLMQTIIRPRGEKLRSHFPNATAPAEKNSRHTCVYQFARTAQFPATVTLELGVTRDREATTLTLRYNLAILPMFFPFEGCDQLSMPLDALDEARIARWVEDKIVGFVETYLSLQTAEQYQAENTATDPVCGMRVNKAHAAATLEAGGQTFYFCLDECRAKFAENPNHYVAPAQRGTA